MSSPTKKQKQVRIAQPAATTTPSPKPTTADHKASTPKTPRSRGRTAQLQLSVSPGVLEDVMEFIKTPDDEVALSTIGKHARKIVNSYAKKQRIKYWGVLDAYALLCITECKLMVKRDWERAIADFEVFEQWQQQESKLTPVQLLVFNRFPSILLYILQQERRTALRADLPRITSAYTLEQFSMLKRLINNAGSVFSLSEFDEKDDKLADMVKEIVRDMRPKASVEVIKRLNKHFGDVIKYIDECIVTLGQAGAADNAPATPRASEVMAAAAAATTPKPTATESNPETTTKPEAVDDAASENTTSSDPPPADNSNNDIATSADGRQSRRENTNATSKQSSHDPIDSSSSVSPSRDSPSRDSSSSDSSSSDSSSIDSSSSDSSSSDSSSSDSSSSDSSSSEEERRRKKNTKKSKSNTKKKTTKGKKHTKKTKQ